MDLPFYVPESAELLLSDAEVKEELKDLLSVAVDADYLDRIVNAINDNVLEELGVSDRHSTDDIRLAIGKVLLKLCNLEE